MRLVLAPGHLGEADFPVAQAWELKGPWGSTCAPGQRPSLLQAPEAEGKKVGNPDGLQGGPGSRS